jgi:hypothetical protein
MVDPEIRDALAQKFGTDGIANLRKYWQQIRAKLRVLARAIRCAEEKSPRLKNISCTGVKPEQEFSGAL